MSVDGAAALGWSSSSHFATSAQRKYPPADVQALMRMNIPISPYSSVQDIPRQLAAADVEGGSLTSVDLKHEYFNDPHPETVSAIPNGPSPQASRTTVRSVENLKVDPITGADISTRKSHRHGHHDRSISAKPRPRPQYLNGMPELSTSYNRMDDRQLSNGQVHTNHKQAHSQERDLPRVREQKGSLQVSVK